MSEACAAEPLHLLPEDLLEVLKPRTVVVATLASLVFALLSMHGLGKPVMLLVVAVSSVIAIFSPAQGFVLCLFLFAFRNEAYSIGPLKLADPLFAITVVSAAFHGLVQGKLRLHASLLYVGIFLATALLSGLAAVSMSAFKVDASRLVYGVIVYLVTLQTLGRRETLLRALKAFLLAGLVMAVCSVAGFLTRFVFHGSGEPFMDTTGRVGMQSIAVDPLRVSSFLTFPMMLLLGLQQRAGARHERRLAEVLFWLGFVACALSFSRSMVLQVVPALFVMWVLTRRQLGRLLFIVLGGLTLLYVLSYMPLDSEVAQQWGLQRWAIAGRLAEDHTEPREVIWRASMRAFASNPIIGVGVGNFMARYFEFREIWETSGYLVVQQRGNHSMYLAALTETGLVGTSAMLLMLGYFLWLGRRVVRQARSDGDLSRYLVGAAILAAYVGEVCGGIALQLLTHNYVWAIIALLPLLDTPRRRAPRAEALPAA